MDSFYRWITHHPRWVIAAIGTLALGAVLVLFGFRTPVIGAVAHDLEDAGADHDPRHRFPPGV